MNPTKLVKKEKNSITNPDPYSAEPAATSLDGEGDWGESVPKHCMKKEASNNMNDNNETNNVTILIDFSIFENLKMLILSLIFVPVVSTIDTIRSATYIPITTVDVMLTACVF